MSATFNQTCTHSENTPSLFVNRSHTNFGKQQQCVLDVITYKILSQIMCNLSCENPTKMRLEENKGKKEGKF